VDFPPLNSCRANTDIEAPPSPSPPGATLLSTDGDSNHPGPDYRYTKADISSSNPASMSALAIMHQSRGGPNNFRMADHPALLNG